MEAKLDELEAKLDEIQFSVTQMLLKSHQQQFESPQCYPQKNFENIWCDPPCYHPQGQFQQPIYAPPCYYMQKEFQYPFHDPHHSQEEFHQPWNDPPQFSEDLSKQYEANQAQFQQTRHEEPSILQEIQDMLNQMSANLNANANQHLQDTANLQAPVNELVAHAPTLQHEADAEIDDEVNNPCVDTHLDASTDGSGDVNEFQVDVASDANSNDEDNKQEIYLPLPHRTYESEKIYPSEEENKLLDDFKKCFAGDEVKKMDVECGSKLAIFPHKPLLINLDIFEKVVLIEDSVDCKQSISIEEYVLKPLPKPPDKELIVECTDFSFTLISGGTHAWKKFSLKLNIVMSHAEGARKQFGFVKIVADEIPPKPPDLWIVVVVPQDYELPLNARPPPDPGDSRFRALPGFMPR
ncbi:uncharacterized protein LOC130729104 [Lotus japonicus]|uniref:uncharacterized protein LOC130729104 n=1 Tax=Lotus japonicus TaxID=34305 RepID=UPI00258BBE91|nr:uncharacterized protein LOC130729104 [Lotus japonicus]XP_057436825.1 uncharacterized protein LOC130729104 [Lotus japonicus]